MTAAGSGAWEDDIVRAFHSFTTDESAALEIVLIDAVADWLLSAANPGSDYSEEHAGHMVSTLFTALDTARTFTPTSAPPLTDEIRATRVSVVEGAHQIAAAGSDGIGLIVSRLMPSVLAELSNNAGAPGKQAHGVFVYLLYAVAIGTGTEHLPAVLDGLGAVFSGWGTVLRDGYVVPWRPRPAATDS
ncbi:hypothetical protein [Pseudonocardia sp. GCM10023141]|uniref:hypothetical protein n=1 Tax=Pseudonocardia sp. GCM10023141 TaxID=3252653 RepID=UPI003616A93E